MQRAKPVTEQDLREHKLLVRIEELETEVEQLERLLIMADDYYDPFIDYRASVH